MPSNKFFGKSKEDLVLLATLGRVLTPEQAQGMTREELAAFLHEKDQEFGSVDKPKRNTKNKEKATLDRRKKPAAATSQTDEESAEKNIEPKEKPARKLSKKELNKQLFLQELAMKGIEVAQGQPLEALKPESPEPVKNDAEQAAAPTQDPGANLPASETAPETAVKKAPARRKTAAAVSAKQETLPETPKASEPAAPSESEPAAEEKKKVTRRRSKTGPEKAELSSETPAARTISPDVPAATADLTSVETATETSAKPAEQPAEGAPAAETAPTVVTTAAGDSEKTSAQAEPASDQTASSASEAGAQDAQLQRHHRHINRVIDQDDIRDDAVALAESEKKRLEKPAVPEPMEMVEGVLEIMPDGYGFLRKTNYLQSPQDIYIPPQYIRRFGLRPGDLISGPGKQQRETDRYQAILYIKEVNGLPPEKMIGRPQFDQLTPIYPNERFVLETVKNELSTRIIDLVAPIGKGQRGMIVSPPKAGKTILLQKIANAISINNPETKLIVLLIDERPEEVTDMQRSINGEVVYSTFDKTPENHVKIVELVLERAMRLVELGQDVVILLDSITRLARAYNLTINPTGRTLSGGLDPGALYGPKRFFGSARNIERGGSLTIIATSLIETGSRMDEVIFEEFKGTGNMEVYLDRKLSEKRIFPAIDLNRSGTRREELLLSKRELDAVWTIRKAFSQLDTAAVTEMIINLLLKTNTNSHFVSSVNVSLNDKAMFDAMRGTKPGGNTSGQGGSSQGGGNSYSGYGGSGGSGGYGGSGSYSSGSGGAY